MSNHKVITVGRETYAVAERLASNIENQSVAAYVASLIADRGLTAALGGKRPQQLLPRAAFDAAQFLAPPHWFLETSQVAIVDGKEVRGKFVQIGLDREWDNVLFVSVNDALEFAEDLRSLARHGGKATLKSLFPSISADLTASRKGNGIRFQFEGDEAARSTLTTAFAEVAATAIECIAFAIKG